MATFITDRTLADVEASKQLIQKVAETDWSSLTSDEQNTYLNTSASYEDKGRFGEASATRISAYLVEITAMYPRTTAWGTKDFKGTFDYPDGTPAYMPIERDHFIAWAQVLNTCFGGNATQWDFTTNPYITYEQLNRMESLSRDAYNQDINIDSEVCGDLVCGEGYSVFRI